MSDYVQVLALAVLPAIGNFAGGLLSEFVRVSQRTLSFALHAAAGIVFAVVGVELMTEALEAEPKWVPILAFALGGVTFLLIDKVLNVAASRVGKSTSSGALAIYFAVAVDLFSDGVMIGTGSTISFSLALLLALGQVTADVPEGFATLASFRRGNTNRARRLLIAASLALPIFLGATLGFWALRGQPELYKLTLLAFTAGILLTVTVEEVIPEAHEGEHARWATVALSAGFALFTLVSAYFE